MQRQGEVRQMISMLDEAIADLRAARGGGRFALTLTAYADPPAIVEPLLPPPTAKEAIEHVLLAARVVDSAAERTSLLASAVAAIDREQGCLPTGQRRPARGTRRSRRTAARPRVSGPTARTMTVADIARQADVRGFGGSAASSARRLSARSGQTR
jgi:hypothetical protein